jgi:hypothetical protein
MACVRVRMTCPHQSLTSLTWQEAADTKTKMPHVYSPCFFTCACFFPQNAKSDRVHADRSQWSMGCMLEVVG